ncbi:MAG TPA: flagellar biosynthetic protein FliQ [Acetobacteraceae bacterium]|nr:flagellar biosynthetic protein FliQ [Acetobacteraceae bacterium]
MDATVLAARDALWVTVQLAGPPLFAMLAVGLAVSILQALTQVNEATLAFLPKLAALGGVLLATGAFMADVLRGQAERLFNLVVLAGSAP